MADTDPGGPYCTTQITPGWNDGQLTTCGSPIRSSGLCARYQHPDHGRCSPDGCAYRRPRCPAVTPPADEPTVLGVTEAELRNVATAAHMARTAPRRAPLSWELGEPGVAVRMPCTLIPVFADRFAHPDRDQLVHSPVVPWRPTDPAPLPPAHLEAVARYLAGDRDTPAQQRGTRPA